MQRSFVGILTQNELIGDKTLIRLIGIGFFFMLTVLGAFIYIPLPFTPVPITAQTFFVILCAAFLRKKDACITQAIYLVLGVVGLPIFSGVQGGILRLLGPTGGYIVGFVFSVIVVSSILDYYRRKAGELLFLHIAFAMSCGILTIYFWGGVWLSILMKLSFSEVLIVGIIPFLPGGIIKVVTASLIYERLSTRLQKIFQ